MKKHIRFRSKSLAYEGKPLVCIAVGLYCMSLHNLGSTAKISGLILVCCALSIMYMRARYRGLIR